MIRRTSSPRSRPARPPTTAARWERGSRRRSRGRRPPPSAAPRAGSARCGGARIQTRARWGSKNQTQWTQVSARSSRCRARARPAPAAGARWAARRRRSGGRRGSDSGSAAAPRSALGIVVGQLVGDREGPHLHREEQRRRAASSAATARRAPAARRPGGDRHRRRDPQPAAQQRHRDGGRDAAAGAGAHRRAQAGAAPRLTSPAHAAASIGSPRWPDGAIRSRAAAPPSPAPAGSSARGLPRRSRGGRRGDRRSTRAPTPPSGSRPPAPTPRSPTSPTATALDARPARAPTWSSTRRRSSATQARWPTTSGSTSAAPRPCSTPPRPPALERAVHVSSVVVYGYDDPSSQDERAHLPRLRHPLHRHQERLRPARAAPRRGRRSAPATSTGRARCRGRCARSRWPRRGSSPCPAAATAQMLPVYIDDLAEAIVLGLARGEPGRGLHRLERRRAGHLRGVLRPLRRDGRRSQGAAAAGGGAPRRRPGDGGASAPCAGSRPR